MYEVIRVKYNTLTINVTVYTNTIIKFILEYDIFNNTLKCINIIAPPMKEFNALNNACVDSQITVDINQVKDKNTILNFINLIFKKQTEYKEEEEDYTKYYIGVEYD